MAGKWHCCGFEIDTNFCSHCGADRRSANPLSGLLRHVEVEMEQAKRKLNEVVNSDGYQPEHRRRRVETKKRVLDKWTAWHDALKAAITERHDH
jgi:hypothetical protein